MNVNVFYLNLIQSFSFHNQQIDICIRWVSSSAKWLSLHLQLLLLFSSHHHHNNHRSHQLDFDARIYVTVLTCSILLFLVFRNCTWDMELVHSSRIWNPCVWHEGRNSKFCNVDMNIGPFCCTIGICSSPIQWLDTTRNDRRNKNHETNKKRAFLDVRQQNSISEIIVHTYLGLMFKLIVFA